MSTSKGQNHPTVITSFEQTPLSGRRPYVSMSGPPSPSSPLARSHYMPDASSGSDEDSPAPTVLMTPTLTAATRGTSPPKGAESYFKTADHAALSSLSHLPSPGVSTENDHNGGNGHNRMGSFPFPLLPPHHPLRGQMYSSNGDANKINLDSSPPSTPKGHPVDPKIRYPKDLKVSRGSKTDPGSP